MDKLGEFVRRPFARQARGRDKIGMQRTGRIVGIGQRIGRIARNVSTSMNRSRPSAAPGQSGWIRRLELVVVFGDAKVIRHELPDGIIHTQH